MIEKLLNDRDNSHTLSKYLCILWSLASYVPFIRLVMRRESLRTARRFAPTSRAIRKPAISASYSTSLLESWKLNHKAYTISSPLGFLRVSTSPNLSLLADPSVYSSQMSQLASVSEGSIGMAVGTSLIVSGMSTEKSAKAYALMLVYG